MRVNLIPDEEFRRDLLQVVRGVLREVARDVVGEALRAEGWLEKRFEDYMKRNPMEALVRDALRDTVWRHRPNLEALADLLKPYIDKRVDAFRDELRQNLRAIARDELRQALAKLVP